MFNCEWINNVVHAYNEYSSATKRYRVLTGYSMDELKTIMLREVGHKGPHIIYDFIYMKYL